MEKFQLLTICVFFGFLKTTSSFSVSVPPVRSVCKKMIPGHDKYKPQTGVPPFSITTDITEVKGGEIVEEGKTFKGFYIQARDATDSPVGTFNENTNAKTHSCGGIKSNAAHHANPDLKEKVMVSWKAPEGYKGLIRIRATAVERFTTFWTPLIANNVTVV